MRTEAGSRCHVQRRVATVTLINQLGSCFALLASRRVASRVAVDDASSQ